MFPQADVDASAELEQGPVHHVDLLLVFKPSFGSKFIDVVPKNVFVAVYNPCITTNDSAAR